MLGMAMAGPYLWGFLPHLVTLGFIADIYQRGWSKKLLIIPALLYSSYYALYVFEYVSLLSLENQIQESNEQQKINFDISSNSLAFDNQTGLTTYYKIPVTYEANDNFPEKYLSSRLITQQKCNEIQKIPRELFEFSTYGASFYRDSSVYSSVDIKKCILSTPEKPMKDIVKISTKEEKRIINWTPISETIYTINNQDKQLGVVKSVFAMRMPVFPFFMIGCALNSGGPSWDCFANLYRSRYPLSSVSGSSNIDKYGNNPIAFALKIEKYKESDYDNFQDYPENLEFIDKWLTKKRNETAEDFNEWGVRKDSPYMPIIDHVDGVESYKGGIYSGKQGGEFYSFIKRNEGKIVFIDANIDNNVNVSGNSFSIYAVCKKTENCDRNDHTYQLIKADGTYLTIDTKTNKGAVKGFWKVRPAKALAGGNDDITILTLSPDANDANAETNADVLRKNIINLLYASERISPDGRTYPLSGDQLKTIDVLLTEIAEKPTLTEDDIDFLKNLFADHSASGSNAFAEIGIKHKEKLDPLADIVIMRFDVWRSYADDVSTANGMSGLLANMSSKVLLQYKDILPKLINGALSAQDSRTEPKEIKHLLERYAELTPKTKELSKFVGIPYVATKAESVEEICRMGKDANDLTYLLENHLRTSQYLMEDNDTKFKNNVRVIIALVRMGYSDKIKDMIESDQIGVAQPLSGLLEVYKDNFDPALCHYNE